MKELKIKKVALIVFYDEKKRILLQNREEISKFGEEWGYFGGQIEKGETPEKAVIRETNEELSFDLKDYEFIGVFKSNVNKELFVERYVFISPLKDKLSKFKQAEGKGMQLFPIEEAKLLKTVPGDDIILRKLEKIP